MNNRPVRGFLDLFLLLLVVCLVILGSYLLYSLSGAREQGFWLRHLTTGLVGLVLALAVTLPPPGFWRLAAWPAYVMLVSPLLFTSVVVKGAERWIDLGPIQIQPSEFAKIGVILVLARLFERGNLSIGNLRSLVLPGIAFLPPFLLILDQPSLSTALSLFTAFIAMAWWRGLRLRDLALLSTPVVSVALSFIQSLWGFYVLAVCGLLWFLVRWNRVPLRLGFALGMATLLAGFASQFVWNSLLHDHQRGRIQTFLDPSRDPGGAGYQVLQSQVAIGSGGWTGKGLGRSTQGELEFIPEEHTDFIFSVYSEQVGFLGVLVLLLAYFTFLARALLICLSLTDAFRCLVVVGIVAMFGFHVVVNISMTMGLMPVTGLPLPFMSYGRSFLLASMIMVGLLLHIRLHAHR